MRYQVYKSLDKPSSMLGIKGSYITFFLVGVVVAAFAGITVGSAVNSMLGFLLFALIGVLAYAGTLAFQGKFSEKERYKWFNSRRQPDYIHIQPRPFSSYIENKKNKR